MNKVPDCQDWTPVVFKKKSNITTNPRPKPEAISSLKNVGVYAAASDDDAKKTKYVAKPTSDAIRTARCEK